MTNFQFKEVSSFTELAFPVACIDICISPNTRKMIATGIYKPTIKQFDLKSGVMKFERHLSSDPIKNFFLEDDGEKFGILRNDKTIEFHSKGGLHEKIKTLKQPKDVVLNKFASELYVGGSFNEINRFSLMQGRFMKSIICSGASRMSFSDIHTLLAAIYKTKLSIIDIRQKSDIFTREFDDELFTVAQDTTGLKISVGTEAGQLLEYDLRSPKVLRSIDVNSYLNKTLYVGKNIIASTSKKIHIIEDSANTTEIEPGFIINTFCTEGGAIYVGGESSEIKTYVCEDFGKIPEFL